MLESRRVSSPESSDVRLVGCRLTEPRSKYRRYSFGYIQETKNRLLRDSILSSEPEGESLLTSTWCPSNVVHHVDLLIPKDRPDYWTLRDARKLINPPLSFAKGLEREPGKGAGAADEGGEAGRRWSEALDETSYWLADGWRVILRVSGLIRVRYVGCCRCCFVLRLSL